MKTRETEAAIKRVRNNLVGAATFTTLSFQRDDVKALLRAYDTRAASKTPETPVGEAVGWVSEWTGRDGKVCRAFHEDKHEAHHNAKWMDGRSYAVREALAAQPDSLSANVNSAAKLSSSEVKPDSGVVEALREALATVDAMARSAATMSAASYIISAEKLGESIYKVTEAALSASEGGGR